MLVQIKYLGKKKIFFPLAYTNGHWKKSVKQSIIYLFIYPSRYRCFGFYGSVSLVPVFPQIYSFSFSCFAGPGSYNPGSTANWLMVIRNENLSCETEKERSQSIFLSPSVLGASLAVPNQLCDSRSWRACPSGNPGLWAFMTLPAPCVPEA